MRVKDVMTTTPVCCKPDDTLERVAELMVAHDCGAVPVCEGKKLVGMITDRDITCRAVAAAINPVGVPVRTVMSKSVHTVGENESVDKAIALMKTKLVRRLPVINDQGDVVGIVAPSDLAPTMASENIADFLLAVSYWNRKTISGAPAIP